MGGSQMTKPNSGGSGPIHLFSPGGEAAVCLLACLPTRSVVPHAHEGLDALQLRSVHALGMVGHRVIKKKKFSTTPPHL